MKNTAIGSNDKRVIRQLTRGSDNRAGRAHCIGNFNHRRRRFRMHQHCRVGIDLFHVEQSLRFEFFRIFSIWMLRSLCHRSSFNPWCDVYRILFLITSFVSLIKQSSIVLKIFTSPFLSFTLPQRGEISNLEQIESECCRIKMSGDQLAPPAPLLCCNARWWQWLVLASGPWAARGVFVIFNQERWQLQSNVESSKDVLNRLRGMAWKSEVEKDWWKCHIFSL